MRRTVFVLVMCVGFAAQAAAQQLYGVSASNLGPLFEIDVATGKETELGKLGFGVSDLAGDRQGGLWGISWNRLFEIDPSSLSVVTDVSFDPAVGFSTLAIHPGSGAFYASGGTSGNDLYQISPDTGNLTSIGMLSSRLTSLAFDNDGRLFGTLNESFFEIDPLTAQIRVITDELSVDRFEDLAFHPTNNSLFGLGYAPYSLFEIDPATGLSTSVGESVIRPSGLAFAYAVPLPTVAGDYNGNGSVDAADYTVWADNFGSMTLLAADGNGDGTVNAADYTVWQDNFGASNAAAQSLGLIPEPGVLALVVIGLPMLTRRRAAI